MIEHLAVPQAAYFYRPKKPLSKSAINNLFIDLRSKTQTTSQNIFRVDRKNHAGSIYSAICFPFYRPATFLKPESKAIEQVFGFLMVVEKDDLVAVVKSRLQLPSDFKAEYLDSIGEDRVERAIAQHDAIFEMIQLDSMFASKHGLRAKKLEARDLTNVVATSSASRFVAKGYKVKVPEGTYSATPSTGRISIRADRTDCDGIVSWAGEIMSLLAANNGTSSSFIRNFARPIDLAALSNGNSAPTYLLIDIPNISASLFDDKSIRLVRESNGTFAEVLKDEASSIFEKIDKSYIINSSLQIVDLDIQQDVGFVKIHKRRIALAEFDSSIADIFVEDPQFEIGGTQDRISLRRYIDRENLFTVLFSDYTLAYMGGTLYRDEGLLNGGKNFLDRFSVEAELSHTDSEKGSFSINQKEFSPKSVFRVLTDHIAKNSNILVCDDLGDEWADFVSIETVSGSPVLSFYHAKHGKLSLGASVFHDSVGQAMKNLGRMDLPSEMMPSKLDSWETPYRNDETVTAIPRILRGGARIKVSTEIDSVRGSPNLIKRVFIVTSSLSLSQLKAAFDDVSKGGQPAPYFVQLYWILNAYFSACAEVGAVGCVVCQP